MIFFIINLFRSNLNQFEPIWTNLNQFHLIWIFKGRNKHDKWLEASASLLKLKKIMFETEIRWRSSLELEKRAKKVKNNKSEISVFKTAQMKWRVQWTGLLLKYHKLKWLSEIIWNWRLNVWIVYFETSMWDNIL